MISFLSSKDPLVPAIVTCGYPTWETANISPVGCEFTTDSLSKNHSHHKITVPSYLRTFDHLPSQLQLCLPSETRTTCKINPRFATDFEPLPRERRHSKHIAYLGRHGIFLVLGKACRHTRLSMALLMSSPRNGPLKGAVTTTPCKLRVIETGFYMDGSSEKSLMTSIVGAIDSSAFSYMMVVIFEHNNK